MHRQLLVCASSVLLLLVPLEAAAQSTGSSGGDTFTSAVTIAEVQRAPSLDLSRWTAAPHGSTPAAAMDLTPPLQTAPPAQKRSATRAILGAIVGGTAGLFAGGYLGAWIEGDSCDCDDAGLTGALVGAPVGMVAGAILGGFFLF